MRPAIPEEVARFLSNHIDSLESLEILLLMQTRADRAWTADQVGDELRISRKSAARRLQRLASRDLLAVETHSTANYRFAPKDTNEARLVEKLATVYQKFRVSVITYLFSRPVEGVLEFAEAFKLRRDEDG